MKKIVAGMMAVLFLAFFAGRSGVHAAEPAGDGEPAISNVPAVVKQIDNAKSEILVQAYSLTSKDIAEALANARKRGVRTQIILDESSRSQKTSIAGYTHDAGIPTYIDTGHDIAANRIFIVDRQTVITDSFNFKAAAGEKSAGNLLILNSYELAKMYIDSWNKHREHSEEYTAKQ